jgi:enoyl-CoA hydratase/3-hydroxyacyl-CoA dehydrogenase
VVFQIATALVFDEKVCSLEDCDLGARVGLRWPKGPFEMMNAIGTDQALALVEAISERYDDVQVPEQLKSLNGAPFEVAYLQTWINDAVGHIQFNRPDAMNALNETVVSQLGAAFNKMEQDGAVKGIVLSGRGKAFVAGADVKFFVQQMKKKDIDRIVAFAANGQKIFRQIDTCDKPVICQLDGLSLGGGSELALACDYIIATSKGTIGFPETGIGIYPGLGGTQRSARRVGIPLARWLVLSGDTVPAKLALGMGLVDQVVSAKDLDEAVREKALSGKAPESRSGPSSIPAGYEDWATVFGAPLDDLLQGNVALPENDNGAMLKKTLKRIGFKAPIALQAADELVRKSAGWDLATGLQAETNGLSMVFGSEDALTGMTSRRPEFQGK